MIMTGKTLDNRLNAGVAGRSSVKKRSKRGLAVVYSTAIGCKMYRKGPIDARRGPINCGKQ